MKQTMDSKSCLPCHTAKLNVGQRRWKYSRWQTHITKQRTPTEPHTIQKSLPLNNADKRPKPYPQILKHTKPSPYAKIRMG